jgi:hypothetical protein
MRSQPVPGHDLAGPDCTGGLSPLHLFHDDLEAGADRWTFQALAGPNHWGYKSALGQAYAHSGTGFLYADDFPAEVSDSAAAMSIGVTLPASSTAYLRFDHAFGFEDEDGKAYDGGVVEYSRNGEAWTDAGPLFATNAYSGTLVSGYGNPLAGRPAFTADSSGYIVSRLNLAPLAGQSVRFRWRMGLDGSRYDRGWWVDDVSVYICVRPGLFLPVIRSLR